MFIGKIVTRFFTCPWRWAGVLTLLSILLYLPICTNGFVFDDHGLIEQNNAIRDISNVSSFFSQDLWAFYYGDDYQKRIHYWRPILLGSWALIYKLSGSNPLGYHLISILLHSLCTFLVFVVGREVMGRERVAAIAAAVFLVLTALSKENGVMVFGILVLYEILLAPRKKKSHSYIFLGVGFVFFWQCFLPTGSLAYGRFGPPNGSQF